MLQKLVIRNYAIIEHLTLTPDAALNTVTGETGAGKSIILGALSLILGDRADTSVLINKDEKSVVEGYFEVKDNAPFREALASAEIEDEEVCIVRREISTSGKSRAFVNDTPVTLQVLHHLTSLLVDLHQQFDYLALETDNFQIKTLDALGGTLPMAQKFEQLYAEHKKRKKQLNDWQEQQAAWQKEADYKQYLLDELLQANFKPNEVEDAAQQLKQMSHAERIIFVLSSARNLLDNGEQPFVTELKRLTQQLATITEYMPGTQELVGRLSSVYEEVKDIAQELSGLEDNITIQPELMEELQQRVDLGYKLFKKHAVADTAALLAVQTALQEALQATHNLQEQIAEGAAQEALLHQQLLEEGALLSAKRREAIPSFTTKMNDLLPLVGMPNALFHIEIAGTTPNASGVDSIQYMLDANKSGKFAPIQKAASGGEMSRIILCIKSLTAQALQMPTLIFDEVDTGISGEAARQVGILLRNLAQYHQVICITHQPQVAAKGSRHFYVFKQPDSTGKLTTQINVLGQEDRIMAIARMIGGAQPSVAALDNAKELVGE